MTCSELIDLLFVDPCGDLDRQLRLQLERHLSECDRCQAYRRSYRATAVLVRRACIDFDDDEPVGAVPDDLVRTVLAALPQA